jgi:hypothetical protein
MNYETFILSIQAHEAMSDECTKRLKEIKGSESGPMGLTPNRIKFSPEYQESLKAYNRAHNSIRQLNSLVPKEYLKRRATERRASKVA